jgi:hypothetical protein
MGKNLIKKSFKISGILFAGYILAQGIASEFFSDKIETTQDLIKIVSQEQPKARGEYIGRKNIWFRYGSTPWGTAASCKLDINEYEIILDHSKDRTTIRHELYHIYAGHCDKAFERGEWKTSDKKCIKDKYFQQTFFLEWLL